MKFTNEDLSQTLARHLYGRLRKILFSNELSDYSRCRLVSETINEVESYLNLGEHYFQDAYWDYGKFSQLYNLMKIDKFFQAHQVMLKGPVNFLH